MHDLPTQTKNLIDCLYSKVRSDNPKLSRPTIEVEFDLIEAENSSGNKTLHLVAQDLRTHSYIYLAEAQEDAFRWSAEDSEFYDRIFVFVRHILQLLEFGDSRSNLAKGLVLKEIATREFKRLTRL